MSAFSGIRGVIDTIAGVARSYDEDEYYDGSDDSDRPKTTVRPQVQQPQPKPEAVKAAADFNRSFGGTRTAAVEPTSSEAPGDEFSEDAEPSGTGLLGAIGLGKFSRQGKERSREPVETTTVIKPVDFQAANVLKDHLLRGTTVIMSLDNEGVSDDMAQRLLDYTAGIAYTLDATFDIISSKTYLIKPGR